MVCVLAFFVQHAIYGNESTHSFIPNFVQIILQMRDYHKAIGKPNKAVNFIGRLLNYSGFLEV